MRLSLKEQKIIRKAVISRDPEAELILFGSRVEDKAKGGDIDLFVISEKLGFRDEWLIRRDILDELGWQKLDLVIRSRNDMKDALARSARENGIVL